MFWHDKLLLMSDSLHQKARFQRVFNCHKATGASPPVAGAAGSSSMGSWALKDLIWLPCYVSSPCLSRNWTWVHGKRLWAHFMETTIGGPPVPQFARWHVAKDIGAAFKKIRVSEFLLLRLNTTWCKYSLEVEHGPWNFSIQSKVNCSGAMLNFAGGVCFY